MKLITSFCKIHPNDLFAWMIALSSIIYALIFFCSDSNFPLALYITIICSPILWVFDKNELKKAGYDMSRWFWWGLIASPIYLFIRARKTTQKYHYAITSLVLFLISLSFSLIFIFTRLLASPTM